MTTRILPPEEWHRLAGTELETVWPLLPPTHTTVMVVEEDGAIVGCWALLTALHAEGLWIAPAFRQRPSVGRRLLRAMRQQARASGYRAVLTACIGEPIRTLLEKVGAVRLPAHFVMPIQEEPCPPLSPSR